MKKKIVVLLLVGGLVAGLCGCGGSSSGSSLPSEAVAEEDHISMETTETGTPDDSEPEESREPESTEPENERYSFDDLVEMWSSGTLLREEIVEMAMAGEIDYDVFEEFLTFADEVYESETSGSGSVASDIDTSSLLTTYVIEFEDVDGYQIRETIQISPIFREGDLETARALWEALGNDVESFPSKKSICDQKRALSNYQLEYVVGTCMIENLTEGFSFTSDSPRSYGMSLTAKGHDGTDAFFTNSSVSAVAYSNGIKYYSDISSVKISDVKLTADAWGPYTFVIALPNAYTPNQPNGYRYDEIQLIFDYNIYEPGDDSRQNIFELKYFK